MLVLSRRTGERIQIGDDIFVTVVRIGPASVRIGIEAPRNVNIVREELTGASNASGAWVNLDSAGHGAGADAVRDMPG